VKASVRRLLCPPARVVRLRGAFGRTTDVSQAVATTGGLWFRGRAYGAQDGVAKSGGRDAGQVVWTGWQKQILGRFAPTSDWYVR
jgi:hypothetical protein